MQKVDRPVFSQKGNIYRVIVASRLASCLHLLRSDPRVRIEGARDPSYFKRAGKRRTGGLIRKFRRC